MNATAVAVPVHTGRPWTQAIRVAVICLAVVVLVALSFVLGRTTVSPTHHSVVPVTVGQGSTDLCRIGRPC
jgi:uncharacterized membrane protein